MIRSSGARKDFPSVVLDCPVTRERHFTNDTRHTTSACTRSPDHPGQVYVMESPHKAYYPGSPENELESEPRRERRRIVSDSLHRNVEAASEYDPYVQEPFDWIRHESKETTFCTNLFETWLTSWLYSWHYAVFQDKV